MEERTLFSEGPVKVTTAWITGGGHDIPLPEVSAAVVRVSKRPVRLALTGVVLGLGGFIAFLLGGMDPPIVEGLWLFLLGILTLVGSAAVLIRAAFQAYPLQRELLLTVSGRRVSLITSTDLALLLRAAETISGSLPVAGKSTS